MKKTTITLLAVLALVAFSASAWAQAKPPAAATTAGWEFTLGGYVKLETQWNSTQMNKNMTNPVFRNNDPNMHHGRFGFAANSTRLNLTIKGPKLWGAQVTGFIEADFDAQGNSSPAAAAPNRDTGLAGTAGTQNATVGGLDFAAGGSTAFRMRHAMFRFNWPETELLFGQYWGYFSSYTPETAQDSGEQFTGSPTQRLPQVRVTQKFLDAWTVSGLVGLATNTLDQSDRPNFVSGESAESPQVQVMVGYEKDHWGKAAFYGRPRGFAAQVAFGWQRVRFRSWQNPIDVNTWGDNNYDIVNDIRQRDNQILNAWMVQGSLFIPVIPTYSANLAGTASISTQWNVGQGLAVFGEGQAQDMSYLVLQQGDDLYDRELQQRFSGFVQGQYYFTNQWFVNAVWGMSRAFGVPMARGDEPGAFATPSRVNTFNGTSDMTKFWQQYNLTLWYRPITALKFGLQYSYVKTIYFQRTNVPAFDGAAAAGNFPGSTDTGESHRVMFAGFFYF